MNVRICRSSRENAVDYRYILRASGIVGAILWTLYGLFCQDVLHLRETMEWRWLLSAGFLFLGVRAHAKRFGPLDRWLWVWLCSMGMVWLPWHIYFLNDRAPYWQMSITFFCLAVSLAIRGVDLVPTLFLGVFVIVATNGSDFGHQDISLVAVAAITMWLVVTGVHTLRSSRRHIEDLARLIDRQNTRLRAIDRGKDEFTANIAHDLRTPLAVALSLSEDMARTDLAPATRKRLESLVEALRQMRRQSEELLDLQRFQLGVAKMDRQVVNLGEWLGKFEEGFTSMARARGLTFQVVLPRDGFTARIDPLRMETALFNLVSNAFKFTPPGGHVEVHLRRQGSRGLALAVLDDGEGIPNDALQKIFERFQQVDRGPGTYTAGVGIGLALVREIAEAHEGRVNVQSTVGLGTLFEIILEDAAVELETPQLQLVPMSGPAGLVSHNRRPFTGHLALVAEDQQLLRHVLHDIVEQVAKVATACDGREALRLVHELHPDILITDFAMPGMDGLELLAALRSDPSTKDLPVILLTGDPVHLRQRLAEEPTLKILGKPFDQAELVEVVRALLSFEPVSNVA
jgi:signal transduction histidine kinase/CheY-like chemotaxis protein